MPLQLLTTVRGAPAATLIRDRGGAEEDDTKAFPILAALTCLKESRQTLNTLDPKKSLIA